MSEIFVRVMTKFRVMDEHGNLSTITMPLTQSIQSMGGNARAKSLTPEQRSQIASKAAKSRWESHKAARSTTEENRLSSIYP